MFSTSGVQVIEGDHLFSNWSMIPIALYVPDSLFVVSLNYRLVRSKNPVRAMPESSVTLMLGEVIHIKKLSCRRELYHSWYSESFDYLN